MTCKTTTKALAVWPVQHTTHDVCSVPMACLICITCPSSVANFTTYSVLLHSSPKICFMILLLIFQNFNFYPRGNLDLVLGYVMCNLYYSCILTRSKWSLCHLRDYIKSLSYCLLWFQSIVWDLHKNVCILEFLAIETL